MTELGTTEALRADRTRQGRWTVGSIGLAFTIYLIVSIGVWWHVWSGHPTTVTTCGCDDPSLSTWFLAWPAYAIAHGHNPFYSTALFHPGGINLLSNTGMLGIGIPLAPITWIFGPVATLNVASTLGPALSAAAMFWLLRRWVQSSAAAFVGGLVFGFSPMVLDNLAVAHLNLVFLVLLPPMVACLDELLVRQRRSSLKTGVVLGLLVTAQFFLSTEILTMAAVLAVTTIVLLVAYAALHPGELAARAPYAGRGLLAALAVALVLLAYPAWFALRGPAHLSGQVWPATIPGSGGIDFTNLWQLHYLGRSAVEFFAGYQGPALPQIEYFGLGMFIVLAAGMVVWRRDRRMWIFGAIGVITVVLALGLKSYWTPWRVLAHIPLILNVISSRFTILTSLCAATLLAIIVDRTHASVRDRVQRVGTIRVGPQVAARMGPLTRAAGVGAALAVAALAIVPMGRAMAGNIPLTTQTVTLPIWFTEVAPHLPPRQVVLTFPPPVTGGSAMTWHAVDDLHFALATGAGPQSVPQRAGKERKGLGIITGASQLFFKLAPVTSSNVDAVRQALAGWGVTQLVVPNPKILVPHYNRDSSTAWALGLFTLALHRGPQFRGDSWVWTDVPAPVHPLSIRQSAFTRCTTPQIYQSPSRLAVPECVLRASHQT